MRHRIHNIGTLVTTLSRGARRSPVRTVIILGLILIGILFFILRSSDETTLEAPQDETTPYVTVESVATLSSDEEALVLLGEVRSVSQAELRAQKSGKVTQVYTTPSRYVSAGTLLAEIDAAQERAAVISAEGALAAAQAQLDKVERGARTEDVASAQASAEGATISLFAAEESARSAYSQAYALAANALFARADSLFTNVYTVRPSFRIRSASFDERREVEEERVLLGDMMEDWREATERTLERNELDTALVQAQNNLERLKQFINTISVYVSKQETDDTLTEATKASQEATLLSAGSSVDSARNVVIGARQGLANARSAQVSASFTESRLVVGERPEDVRAVEASVTQARGALLNAQALLENARIRSPIAGTVTTFNVSVGDFVNAFDSIALVSNPSALEIEAYVSSLALNRIEVGMPVRIAGTYDGVVTSRALGLDPVTKKARITVSVPENANLVNGAFVEIALGTGEGIEATPSYTDRGFAIPIPAIKVLPQGLAVFTVNEENTLVAVPIQEGPIVGARMLVEGIEPDLQIVTDVRGHKEGDVVTVTY